ncbi:MAG: hypothetical protein E7255_11360 [Lachnospiraceae bacterium]|nr:hypothetical protein [Lachnospiraceae bacterium]
MKKKTKIILLIMVIALAAAGFYAGSAMLKYILHDDYKKILHIPTFEKAAEFQALTDKEVSVPGMVLAAENRKLKLYTDPKTTEIVLYDKIGGQAYYSNPADRGTNPSGGSGELLNAQFSVEYYNSSRQIANMDNYSMSILKDQFSFESIKDGIRYTYVLGDLASKTGIVPTMIAKERLEGFLSCVPEDKATNVRKKYIESKEQEGRMELLESAITAINIKRMSAIFEEAGYTREDYELDMAEAKQEETVSFTIPLDYRLTEDGLSVSIATSEIKETGGAKLYDIQLLKYFGAANSKQDGYIMVPNGSGSLIYFNNGKSSYSYTQYLYDMDPTVASYTVVENTTAARLPVFGMKYETGALFTRITSGDALARIDAATSGGLTDYNNVYATFYLRGYELLSMFGTTGTQSDLPVVESNLYKTMLQIEFVPLNGSEADYSGMAAYYRSRLIEEGVLGDPLPDTELPFYLDIVGGVNVKKNVAGIRYRDVLKMTTYEEAQNIVEKLAKGGISNIRMNYLGWFNGGYYHDVPDKIKGAAGLGSHKDMAKLNNYLSADGGGLFGNVALNKVSCTSSRYFLSIETSKYYTGKAVVLSDVNPYTLNRGTNADYEEAMYAILSPRFLDYYTERFADTVKTYDMSGIALRDLGDVLSSDKKRNGMINRQEALEITENAFKTCKDTGKSLLVHGGNAYSFAYTSDIVDAPLGSSKFFVTDETIPFYEMVIHGYINYTGSELNLTQSADRNDLLLDLIETGAAPRYVMSWENSDRIKYTGLNRMCSVQYELWDDEAEDYYAKISEALKDVVNVVMVKHEILNDSVRKVTYANGMALYINRGSEDTLADGITIPAKWYSKGGLQ